MNQCDRCTECCSVMAVAEINKPRMTRCQHLKLGKPGCQLHPSHPAECKSYACLYVLGHIGSDVRARPDKLGVIFDARLDPKRYVATECRKDALMSPEVRNLIRRLSEQLPVQCITFEGESYDE